MIQCQRQNNQNGQVMLLIVFFFLMISTTVVFGIATPILKQVAAGQNLFKSKQGYFLAHAGLEDAAYRLMHGKQTSASETLALDGGTAAVAISATPTGKEIIVAANVDTHARKVRANLILGNGVAFRYGIQSGNGGFVLNNSSTVTGNVFSGGSIIGNSVNDIYGDIISSGPSGQVYGVHSTGSVFAHTIGKAGETTHIDGDAYYVNKLGTVTVGGTLYPGSADQAGADLPISDEQIEEWKGHAADGGTISSCTNGVYTVDSTVSLGPVKITCNLLIKSSSAIVTVAGPIWVTGNITVQTGPTIRMDPALGSQNVAVVADNPSNRLTSSIIDIGQSTTFQGSGSPGSFVFMISQNNSAETGGSTAAISMSQGASALVAYASHGQVNLNQSANVKEVTAYKIVLSQSANITYDTGLPSVLFSSGPAGGYEIADLREIP